MLKHLFKLEKIKNDKFTDQINQFFIQTIFNYLQRTIFNFFFFNYIVSDNTNFKWTS